MMFRSLYSKLAAVVLGLFTVIAIVMVVVVVYSTDMYRQEINQELNMDLAAQIVGEQLLIRDGEINDEALEYIFHIMMVINPAIEVYLLDPQGTILAYSAPPGKVKLERVSLGPIGQMLSSDNVSPLLGDDPRNPHRRKVFSVAPIHQNNRLEGYLYVVLGGEEYQGIVEKIQGSYILTMSSWMIVVTILSAVAVGLLIFALLTRRLKKLTAAVEVYFKKGMEPAAATESWSAQSTFSGDEVDDLSSAFQEMADRIEEQVEKLQKSDLLRRELVANVSHDLRTPLATLSAYIETLLLNNIQWSEEERYRYLKVAHKHCKRLNSLVDDLFELASLEAEEKTLKLESFNIAELIQDVVQNYELAAQQKNISLSSNIGQASAHVIGDIGLIERVLENLIGNALRYTPQDGGVSIIMKPSSGDMIIQVCDTGEGIPRSALPHIFDRFYKVEDGDKNHGAPTGLGLAIAKRILDLHGSTIEAESTPGEGTCFTFVLPLHTGSR